LKDQFWSNFQWDMSTMFLNAATYWASGSWKWVSVLDQNCGPKLSQVEFGNARPLVSLPDDANTIDDIWFNEDFWAVATMARFVRPGAKRVTTTVEDEKNAFILAFRDDAAERTILSV